MEQMKTVQPERSLTITLVQCDQFLHRQLKGSRLWGASGLECREGGIPVKLIPADSLHGWDSARVCKVADINRSLRTACSTPIRFTTQVNDEGSVLTAKGCIRCWQIAPGGAGRNLNLALSVEDCTLQMPEREPAHFPALTAIVQINLSALPLENAGPEQASHAEVVSVLSVSGGEKRRLWETALLKLALGDWCREHLDMLLSFFREIDTVPAGQRRYACMDAVTPGADMVGVLSSEDPSRIPRLQSILPVERQDAILVNQNSETGRKLLRTLPVFEKFPIHSLEADGDGSYACTPVSLPAAGENDIPLKINSFCIRTQPHLQVELDISLRLPNGTTVHLTAHTEFEAVLSAGSVRFGETHTNLTHYADIPGGELTEEQQQEISQAVKRLAEYVGVS